MDLNLQKKLVAEYAIKYIEEDMVLGVGTGSTVKYFIDALSLIKHKIDGAVSSSEATTKLLKQSGIRVYDLNSVGGLDLYIDGADECDHNLRLIKGGGAALTREKIIANASKKFICIADSSKLVNVLGKFPVPIEVIPMARSYVGREIVRLGGVPEWRENVLTDNGNWIIDVYNFNLLDPQKMEARINNIAGVVTVGIFANRGADLLVTLDDKAQIKLISKA